MTEPPPFELPAQVCRRDGEKVPFDPDRICHSIFLATEALQQANAFLARELTDGVLHFLAQEHGGGTPTTDQIAELVAKVLRELGQASLAQAFEQVRESEAEKMASGTEPAEKEAVPLPLDEGTPERFVQQCWRLFSRHRVFSRDLMAAQDEGFLTLSGLEHPAELAGGLAAWPGNWIFAAVVAARRRYGGFVVVDSPEHLAEDAANFVGQLTRGLEATGLRAIVNLNAAEPPSWAKLRRSAAEPPLGPLFQSPSDTSSSESTDFAPLDEERLALLENLTAKHSSDLVRVDWHLGEHDFQEKRDCLKEALRTARQRRHMSFVLDRKGSPVALAEGVDRKHDAVLQVVGLHLNRLADMNGIDGNPEALLLKLLHLAQMAVSAGVQKRRFLKQTTEARGSQAEDLRRGFFLDRARLSVVPVGLAAVVQRFTGQTVTGKQGLALAKQIVERLGKCLLQAGRAVNLDAILESPWWDRPLPGDGPFFAQPYLAGLTSADFAASAEDQLRAGGVLHQLTGSGTATLLLPPDEESGNVERLIELLHFAWKKTALVRVRLAVV